VISETQFGYCCLKSVQTPTQHGKIRLNGTP
jgi:hypothetical protein